MVGGMKKVRSGATCVAVLLSAWLVAAEHVTLASLLTRAGQGAGLAQAGCMSQLVSGTDAQGGSEGCQRGAALIGATAVLASGDGRNVYVASSGSDAVAAFSRSAVGGLQALGCVSNNGTNGLDGTKHACADGDALRGASALALSPDGKNVYAAAWASSGIAIFSRDAATGRLSQIGCVRAISTCVGARGLSGATAVVVSPDGQNVYVASYDADALVSFARDPSTGLLKGLGCISDDGTDRQCASGNALRGADALAMSPDGLWLYVATADSNAVLTFERDPSTGLLTQRGCVLDHAPQRGSCTPVNALITPEALALAPDGRTLFVASYDSNAIDVFARDPATGKITERGCLSDVTYSDNSKDGCVHAAPLYAPSALTLSPDGRRIYVTADSGLVLLDRDPATGGLHYTGCVTYADYGDDTTKNCVVGKGLAGAAGIALSPSGTDVYVAASNSNALSTFVPAASVTAVRALTRHGLIPVRLSCPLLAGSPCAGIVTLTVRGGANAMASPHTYALATGQSQFVFLRPKAALIAHDVLRHKQLRLLVSVIDRRNASSIRALVSLGNTHRPGPSRPHN